MVEGQRAALLRNFMTRWRDEGGAPAETELEGIEPEWLQVWAAPVGPGPGRLPGCCAPLLCS